MNLFVILNLIPAFVIHLLIMGAITLVVLFLNDTLSFIDGVMCAIALFVLAVFVGFTTSGWEYIFSSETIYEVKQRISLVAEPTIKESFYAGLVGSLIGYFIILVGFYYRKFISNRY